MFNKIKVWYSELPENKKWIDFITALLTVPVLLTIIYTNVGNLKKNPEQQKNVNDLKFVNEKNNIPEKEISEIIPSVITKSELSPTPFCKPEIPEFSISFPGEGDKIEVDPLCVTLNYPGDANYCPVVWAYRVNNSSWSTYNRDPICMYNMASGQIKLEVRIKSTNSGEEKTLIRNFIYKNSNDPVPSPTLTIPVPTLTGGINDN